MLSFCLQLQCYKNDLTAFLVAFPVQLLPRELLFTLLHNLKGESVGSIRLFP